MHPFLGILWIIHSSIHFPVASLDLVYCCKSHNDHLGELFPDDNRWRQFFWYSRLLLNSKRQYISTKLCFLFFNLEQMPETSYQWMKSLGNVVNHVCLFHSFITCHNSFAILIAKWNKNFSFIVVALLSQVQCLSLAFDNCIILIRSQFLYQRWSFLISYNIE